MAISRISRTLWAVVLCLLVGISLLGCAAINAQTSRQPVAAVGAGGETGRYFALVIGIDKYSAPIPQLHTAVSDARAVAEILEKQYGFQVALLTDAGATRARILDQIAAYQSQLSPNDNLLIYYAGHGFRIEEVSKSFWLPVDATSKQSSNRISADDLTTEMATSKARHVLIISDSCYSGGLTRDLTSVPATNPDEAFLRKTLATTSRNIMASGRDEPVADGGPYGHSVFAWAVLQALTQQADRLFTASALFYGHVQRAVAGNSEQVPVYQPIRNSGDIGGDFVFRRVTATPAEVAARLAAASSGYDRGLAFFSSGDYTHAAPILTQGCGQGDLRACLVLGTMYHFGSGLSKDYAQATLLYRKGCDGGLAEGCSNLGVMYLLGTGVAKNPLQAQQFLKKGCDGGNTLGCFNYGHLLHATASQSQDAAQSATLYRLAADLYQKSCDDGVFPGCAMLGTMYETGKGVTKDYLQAASLYRKGCDKGDPRGCSYLGYMYLKGLGLAKDDAQAFAVFRKGCDGADAYSCTTVGGMYSDGVGIGKDDAQALMFFRKGCDGGNADGCSNLEQIKKRQHPQ